MDLDLTYYIHILQNFEYIKTYYNHKYVDTYIHLHKNTYIHTCMHAYIRMPSFLTCEGIVLKSAFLDHIISTNRILLQNLCSYIHTFIHTYIHTYIHNILIYSEPSTLTFANGDKYLGEFKEGRMTGQGTFWYNSGKRSGDVYEGEMFEDFRQGKVSGSVKLSWGSSSSYGIHM